MQKKLLSILGLSLVSGIAGGALVAVIVLQGPFDMTVQEPPSNVEQTNNVSIREVLKEKEYVSQEDLVVDIVEKSTPAVVSIVITKDVPVLEQYYEDAERPYDDFFFGSPFQFRVPRYRESGETEEREIGGGSGFLISKDGYIVTNRHVVDEEDVNYTVFTNDGTEYEATVVAKDTLHDIAVLKIEGDDFAYLEFGDSDQLKTGQTVIAIGNPLLEFNNSVSVGVISGLSRNITAGSRFFGQTEYMENVIQTDAAINPGNSGGPLLDLTGNVIGVNVAIANGENIGFSIPSDAIIDTVHSIQETGTIVRPYLGVRYVPITPQLQEKNNLSVDYGMLVLRGRTMEDLAVIPGSPADKAGIEENDIILKIDGEKLETSVTLRKQIASKNVGDTVTLTILHDGEEKEIEVILEESPQHATS
ncbi:PDZ domain-containing protein [Candidatus Peregrinibacteria bacterium]|nr:PDZ domain-containing protein [Candidatus Peregrinibacteria bacterium]